MLIEHYTNRRTLEHARQATGQLRIIGKDGADPNHDGIAGRTHLEYPIACRFAGDRHRFPARQSRLAVGGNRKLDRHVRPPLRHARDMPGVIAARLIGAKTDLDGDAFRPHALVSLPGHLRIWIFQCGDDARDARTDNGVSARRRLALMRTWFKGHVHRGALRHLLCPPERLDFGMWTAAVLGPAPANQ